MNLSSLSLISPTFLKIVITVIWVYSLKIDYGHLLSIEVLQLSCYLEIRHIQNILSTHELKVLQYS